MISALIICSIFAQAYPDYYEPTITEYPDTGL
jgi:hypothetical protein